MGSGSHRGTRWWTGLGGAGDCRGDDDPATEPLNRCRVTCSSLKVRSVSIYHWLNPRPCCLRSTIGGPPTPPKNAQRGHDLYRGKAQRLLWAGSQHRTHRIHGALVGPTEYTGLQVSNCLRPSARAATPPPNCKAEASSCPPSAAGPVDSKVLRQDGVEQHLPPDGWRSRSPTLAGVDRGFILSDHADWTDCSTSFATARPNAWASPTDQPRLFRAISKNSKVWRALSWAINGPSAMETTDEAIRPACSGIGTNGAYQPKGERAGVVLPRGRRPRWRVGRTFAHGSAAQETWGQSESPQVGARTHWSAGLADGSLSIRSWGQFRNLGLVVSEQIQDLRTFIGPNHQAVRPALGSP